ncbi:MAG: branched-chain amino acid aminotransferase [Bacteroidia bacterium]|nr:branched-chain amino acid aminotransferase [Bacteroidia bacterium]MDW8158557.1 branched-chain amino acid aminotransferase [Bacteroidia bacterium]
MEITTITLESNSIKIEATPNSRLPGVDLNNVKFGSVFSDHMFILDYEEGKWQNPRIVPYGDILMSPSISGLHYGQSIFEGMKAFRDKEGNIHIFRPILHLKRLNKSAARLCMPEVPEDIFLKALEKLISLDHRWVPKLPGALYIRPILFAVDEFLGMRPSLNYKLIIFTLPVNVYYNEPLKVYVTTEYVRASSGGIGYVKAAGNYARSLLINKIAQSKGCNVVLWLDAKERKFIEEYSTMNAFFVIDDFVVTPRLTGTILEGVTRDSVIQLLKAEGYRIYEREIAIDEVLDMLEKGHLKEAFGTGTAAVMAPVQEIHYRDNVYKLSDHRTWKIFPTIEKKLADIRALVVPDTFNWLHHVSI